jgi:2-polyprenyl-3-methyl-5-hydroxy-6-metoxy-1,4-benzoquinol methylase
MDIRGSGPFDFLKWRAKKNNVNIRFWDTDGGVPALCDEQFDVIIAMDSIEHIKEWKVVVQQLSKHLRDEGVMFSNNAILEDHSHGEHYAFTGKEFVHQCIENSLMPLNQIAYKKTALVTA